MVRQTGVSLADATLTISAFIAGMIAGRAVMSVQAMGRLDPIRVVRGGIILTFLAVLVPWLSGDYLLSAAGMLVAGFGIGPAAQWVTVILFIEVARRAHKTLRRPELFVLFYMAGAVMHTPFAGLFWRQFYVQSNAAHGAGVAPLLAEQREALHHAEHVLQRIPARHLHHQRRIHPGRPASAHDVRPPRHAAGASTAQFNVPPPQLRREKTWLCVFGSSSNTKNSNAVDEAAMHGAPGLNS